MCKQITQIFFFLQILCIKEIPVFTDWPIFELQDFAVVSCVLFHLSPSHLVDDGSEIGGAVELDGPQALKVGLQHALDGHAVRVLRVGVLWETEEPT